MNPQRSPVFIPLTPTPLPTDRPIRILICAVQIPFISGGAENHIESLRRELARRNFEVDVVRLPLKWYPPRQLISDTLAWRFLDLTQSYGLPVDLLITTRFPSYAVRHGRKIAWVLHQHRQAYDLLTTDYTDFKDTPDDDHVRKTIYDIDTLSLKECRKIFANSKNVAARMKKYLDIDSEPLYHPPPLAGRYKTAGSGDYILSVGRLETNKRVDLLIKSLAKTKSSVRAIIAGKGPQEAALKKLASETGVSDRVKFTGFVDDTRLIELYAQSGCVFYAPLDEDYGYITLEAFLSRKPVLTARDSGGVLEFVTDNETGYISESVPEAMAEKIDTWFDAEDKGRRLGENGYHRVKHIHWDAVIHRLTEVLREDGWDPSQGSGIG